MQVLYGMMIPHDGNKSLLKYGVFKKYISKISEHYAGLNIFYSEEKDWARHMM